MSNGIDHTQTTQTSKNTPPHFNDPKYQQGTSMHPGRTEKGQGAYIQNTLKQPQVMKLTVALIQRREVIASENPPRMEDLCKELTQELGFPITEYNIIRQIKAGIIPDFRPKKRLVASSKSRISSKMVEEMEARIQRLESQVADMNNLSDAVTYYKNKITKLEEIINQIRKDLYTQ